MTFKLTSPSLILTFEGNDLEPGHSTSQTITNEAIINRSYSGRFQRFSNLKSSSDTIGLQIRRKCASTEDIIATQGNIKAVLRDGENTVFTGYISTSFRWTVSDHGEQALAITLESVGTRLFNQPFIETGKHFFRCSASAALYSIVNPLGITIHAGDERKILQDVSIAVEAGTTCRELIDQLLYECNAVYFFNEEGELCIQNINPQTAGAETIDSDDLYVVNNEAVSLSKSLRAYKGARVTYSSLAEASNYLVYRNTTGQDSSHPYCNLELKNGEYFDGTEIYTSAEWSAAQADEFREPALIGAVNADSESQIVGSGKIVNIDNLRPDVIGAGMACTFENVGGGYFKLTAHNGTGGTRQFTRMDLYANIVYEKSQGVIRTQIDGTQTGKDILKEDLKWLHDKDNATAHANLLAQYHQYAGATYTFRTRKEIALGSVIKLHEDLYSGLEVYVLVTACEVTAGSETVKYTAVGISTFDLSESAYHGTTQPANQSGAQGPAGEPGAAAEVQYAIGDSIIDPPADEMLWNSVTMEWDDDPMLWQVGLWGDEVPDMERGKYIWMRTRTGDAPWQYTRLTGSISWDAEDLGVFTTACPTTSREGLGLIPGDYFVAGATFTDNNVEYKKGYAYTYTGSGWSIMDLTDPANSSKALQCLSSLITSGINVTDSTASVWGWFQNLVAQNAVIENLIAKYLTVGSGDGTSGSGFRFRALNDDGNGSPIFDIMYGDSTLFSVEIATGKIYFGTGFWYDPSDMAIHSVNDGVVIDDSGSIIINDGMYRSNLSCPSFRSLPRETIINPIVISYPSNAQSLYNSLMSNGITDGSIFYPCTVSTNSQIKFVQYTRVATSSRNEWWWRFYDSSLSSNYLAYIYRSSNTYGWYNLSSNSVITIGSASSVVFQFLKSDDSLSVPDNSQISQLNKGEIYYVADSGGTTGTLHIKL